MNNERIKLKKIKKRKPESINCFLSSETKNQMINEKIPYRYTLAKIYAIGNENN